MVNFYSRADFTAKPTQHPSIFKQAASAVMYRAKSWSLGVVCGVAAFPFQIVLTCLTSYLVNKVVENDAKVSDPISFTTMVIFVPLLEELVFRGAVQGGLSYVITSPTVRVLGTAALFSGIHLTNTKNGFFGAVVQSTVAAISSAAIAGTLKEKTGTVFSSVGAHMANNGCVWGMLHLLQSVKTT
ncbi:MAG: CPBP family intramembrane metalloprotease [Chlamydiales bacterium]|nr:CPBP family intramembrane metalloprotease [Chlamydiales bacterium]